VSEENGKSERERLRSRSLLTTIKAGKIRAYSGEGEEGVITYSTDEDNQHKGRKREPGDRQNVAKKARMTRLEGLIKTRKQGTGVKIEVVQLYVNKKVAKRRKYTKAGTASGKLFSARKDHELGGDYLQF